MMCSSHHMTVHLRDEDPDGSSHKHPGVVQESACIVRAAFWLHVMIDVC
jgi:hypothetical protein